MIMITALATLLAARDNPKSADFAGLPDQIDPKIVVFKELCQNHPEQSICRFGLYG